MKLIDFLRDEQNDFDTYDTVFDAIVTVCWDDTLLEEMKSPRGYDGFTYKLLRIVDILECSDTPVVDWSGLLYRNIDLFRDFANKYWYKNNWEDNDDFVCEWIEQIHLLLAGYESDDGYKKYIELLERCE